MGPPPVPLTLLKSLASEAGRGEPAARGPGLPGRASGIRTAGEPGPVALAVAPVPAAAAAEA